MCETHASGIQSYNTGILDHLDKLLLHVTSDQKSNQTRTPDSEDRQRQIRPILVFGKGIHLSELPTKILKRPQRKCIFNTFTEFQQRRTL